MIFALIGRARRRFLWNEIFGAVAFAATLMIAGLVLLLLAGTQLFDWRWIAPLTAAGLAVAGYRIFRRLPSAYQVAILVDSRAGLHDALSTALHFENTAASQKTSESVRACQKQQAERLSDGVSLPRAIPFQMPRAIYAMAALSVLASSLFALRYGLDRRLDLKPPLTQLLADTLGLELFASATDKPSLKKGGPKAKRQDLLSKLGIRLPESDRKDAGPLDGAPDSALDSVGVPEVNNEKAQNPGGKTAPGKADASDKTGDQKGDADSQDSGDPTSSGKNASADNPAGSREGPQQGEQSAGKPGNSNDSSSLLSKLRDAVSNLMSKAKSPPNNAGGQKPGNEQGGQQAQSKQQQNGEKGAPGQGQKAGGQESADAQDGQQNGDPDAEQNAPGKGAGKGSDKQAAAQPGSGIGKQDGAKDVKLAEQLAAMGKLSEIIGKRSANVSGEMTVEVQSGPQQLRTAYSRRTAQHGDAGSEIGRDEIPVALQPYVQQYFEEIRKEVPARKAAK